jgi:endonuclease YncB( thermonuclease family)
MRSASLLRAGLGGVFIALGTTFTVRVEAETLVGKVVGVSDGDTITVLDSNQIQHKVRLAGIDAPEKRQPFGSKSREALASMVFQKLVDIDWKKHDRYGRLVGKVTVGGLDVCRRQLDLGLAWHYVKYAKEQTDADRSTYSAAERAARDSRRGLWSDPLPVPPWEFRHTATSSRRAASME